MDDELDNKLDSFFKELQDDMSGSLRGYKGDRGSKGDKGDSGKDGKNGKDGRDGKNGSNGKDGRDGKDGVDGKGVDPKELQTIRDRLNNVGHGGGNANRNIVVEGRTVLTPYGDINFVGTAASIVSITDNVKKQTIFQIPTGNGAAQNPSISGAIKGGNDKDILFVHPASIIAQDDNFQWDTLNTQLQVGPSAGFDGNSQIQLSTSNNVNNFSGYYSQNKSAGDSASTDVFVGADNDSLSFTGHFVDMGINSSGFVGAALGVIRSISLNAGGTGYTVGDVLTIVSGDSNATATVAGAPGGIINSLALTTSGTGYSVAGALSLTGGTGANAKVNVVSLFDTTVFQANDGYAYTSGGNMIIGTDAGVLGKSLKVVMDGLGTPNQVAQFSSSVLQLGNTGSVAGQITFLGKTSGSVLLVAPSVITGYMLTLPSTVGVAGQFWQNKGVGITDWASVTAAAFGNNTEVQYNNGGVLGSSSLLSYDPTLTKLAVSSTIAITNGGSVAALQITQNSNTSASISIGGALNVNNTNNTGAGFVLYSNHGAGQTGRQMVVYTQASAMAIDTALIQSDATNNTALNIKGVPTSKGVVKIEHLGNTGGDSNGAALSIDLPGSGTAAQGIFMDATGGGTTGKLITLKNNGTERMSISATGVGLINAERITTLQSGSGAPGTTPSFVGEMYVDTTGKKGYIATGTTNSSDWTILN